MRGRDFSKNWKFAKQDTAYHIHRMEYDDSDWEVINVPHDWSIYQSFDQENGEGCNGYITGGFGWYRKKFTTTEEMKQGCTYLHFDGIYNRAHIYCNGQLVDFQPYGYIPILVDVSAFLKDVNEENIIAVSVDHTRDCDCRWYSGSGIYRKVAMHILPMCHIPVWGVQVETERIEDNCAYLKTNITCRNESKQQRKCELNIQVISPEQLIVEERRVAVLLEEKNEQKVTLSLEIRYPTLWKIGEGKQYSIKTQLYEESQLLQETVESFGIRTFRFDANAGFFLNQKHMLIKGVCLHHTVGSVGAAVPLDAWRRRIVTLMECGANAIRTGHNPVSEDFLDLCDELGILVMEEYYDEWDNPKDKRLNGPESIIDYKSRGNAEFFKEYAQRDIERVITRDYNHPCIFMWSIGNEIEWTYSKYNDATGYFGAKTTGNYFYTTPPNTIEEIRENVKGIPREEFDIGSTAQKLSDWTKALDTTRPVTANCILPSVSYETGFVDALDVVGYSYRRVIYDYGHQYYPDKPIVGAENVAQWHEWKAVIDRKHVAGIFVWTGADYIGEVGDPDSAWPTRSTDWGMLDMASLKKPSYYMYQSLWTEEPCAKIMTQVLEKSLYTLDENQTLVEKVKDGWQERVWFWQDVNEHWNYEEGELTVIEVYSNWDSMKLYINNKEISELYLAEIEDRIYKWVVPFQKGIVRIEGMKNNQVCSQELKTGGVVDHIHLTVDKTSVRNVYDDVVHIVAQLEDVDGNPVQHTEEEIEFLFQGAYRYLGIDNGSRTCTSDFYSNRVVTNKGRCLVMLQGIEEGVFEVEAVIQNKCKSNKITVSVVDE